ncbi:hypothetical protein [Thermus scotoductus]|uniref:Phage tail protein n=1 Tax=Thermus scotoductus TaxID=37636 RepID=A0A430RUM7_THESC|nr:hypothetical protein [Thermus scotoductus]RTG99035.1 hypothetical protein CSW51_00840 [Thermus scotoductus]RTH23431.1 hypothetical protein CSW38_10520 [Thermus scotoductus]
MIAPVLEYLKAACAHAGLPPTRVLVGRSREEAYRMAPAALIQPLTGALKRDGSRVVAGPVKTRRRLYGGQARFRLELYARSQEELDRLLTGVLLYLWETPLVVGEEHVAKLNDLTLSFLDEEGALIGEHAAALEVPVEVALYEGTAWVPVRVEVEEAVLEEEV